MMLTERQFKRRVKALMQKVQENSREGFQHNIDLLYQHNINDYKTLLEAISNIELPDEVRIIACWLVARIGDKDSLPVLLSAARDKSPTVRRQAVQALGELHIIVPEVLQTITRALSSDYDTEVRFASAYALGELAHEESLTPLLNTLNSKIEDPSVRGMAIEALISHKDRSVIPLLIALLTDDAAEVRFWSSFALGQMGAKEALPELERLAKEDHAEVPGWHKVSQEASDAIQIIKQSLEDSDTDTE